MILRSRLLWILLVGVAVSLIILIARRNDIAIGRFDSQDFASLTYQIGIVVFVGGSVIVLFRDRLMQALEAAVFWIAIGLVLVIGYSYRSDLGQVGERVMAELVPGRTIVNGRSVEFTRSRAGEFQVNAQVNGASVPMVIDTGASSVVLTHDAAKAAGLPLEVLDYTVAVDTANGRTKAAPVTLDRLGIGGVVERSVPALIARPGQLRTNLLGMSFMNRLESWEVRGDHLTMRGYP